MGEISAGIALLALLVLGKKLSPVIADKAFFLAKLLIAIIMFVAIYVHLHPDVPAETLPLGAKPPYLTLFVLLLVGLNIYLHRKNNTQPYIKTIAVEHDPHITEQALIATKGLEALKPGHSPQNSS